jgi:lipopolysaccharide biosynthesis glycosyltransferase
MQDKIKNKINLSPNVYFMDVEKSNLFQSSANKFKIYQFDKVTDYDKIIFCDCDVIFTRNPQILFDLINDDKIYVANEVLSMATEYYDYNLTEEDIQKIKADKLEGFSAGFFGFNSNCIHIFELLDNEISKITKAPKTLEQPVFVSYLFKNNLYSTAFNNLVSHLGREYGRNDKDILDLVVFHFAGIVGNYFDKYTLMFQFYLKWLVK